MNQSSLSKNLACTSTIDYNKLIQLRTIGNNPSNPIPPVTTLAGRVTGQNIIFTGVNMYDDYKMRRKVEILQNRKNINTHTSGVDLSKKQLFSRMSKVKGSSELSQYSIKNLFSKDCPAINPLVPPTYSGVRDISFSGYRLDKTIPFKRFL